MNRKRAGFKPSKASLLLFLIPISHLVPLLEFNQSVRQKSGRVGNQRSLIFEQKTHLSEVRETAAGEEGGLG